MRGGFKRLLYFFKRFLAFPSLLFMLLWVGINTGPWVFKHTPQTMMQYFHYFRTLAPYIAIYMVFAAYLVYYRGRLRPFDLSLRMWVLYGILGLLASLNSPHPFDASYWAFAYLSVFAVAKLYMRRRNTLEHVTVLNYLTWIMASLFLAVILILFKDALLSASTGYGIVNKVSSVGGMAMPRSSGVARFAAIPAIVGFVLMWKGRHLSKLFWGAVFVSFFYLIYFMQSRGAIIALSGTIVLMIALMGRHVKLISTLAAMLMVFSLMLDMVPEHLGDQIKNHLMRGQTAEELETLTGRTRAWNHALERAAESPVIGYGFQADRYLIGEHVHNAYMYALLTAGGLGLLLFFLGYFFAWLNIVRSAKYLPMIKRMGHERMFVTTVGIVAFFTLRSIPEASGAIFAVDLMVLVPAMLYLGVLRKEVMYQKR